MIPIVRTKIKDENIVRRGMKMFHYRNAEAIHLSNGINKDEQTEQTFVEYILCTISSLLLRKKQKY